MITIILFALFHATNAVYSPSSPTATHYKRTLNFTYRFKVVCTSCKSVGLWGFYIARALQPFVVRNTPNKSGDKQWPASGNISDATICLSSFLNFNQFSFLFHENRSHKSQWSAGFWHDKILTVLRTYNLYKLLWKGK